MMTLIETVDCLVLLTCLSGACLILEINHKYSINLRIESTERQILQMQVMKIEVKKVDYGIEKHVYHKVLLGLH